MSNPGRRLLIVHNPTAGAHGTWRLTRVVDRLRQVGAVVEVRRTESLAQCQQLVRSVDCEGGFDAVVAAGGDGTVRAVATVLTGTQTPLGIIPVGTGNVMAHEIGLTLNSRDIADCLMNGSVVTLKTAYANGEPFFLMVGAGFDGRVTRWLDMTWKRQVGKLAYTWPVIRGLMSGPDHIRVRVGEREVDAGWVVATIGQRYAGSFLLAPKARMGSPGLQTVLFKPSDRRALFGQLLDMAAGRIGQRSDIEQLPATTVEIVSDQPIPVQIDGEPFGSTPVRIETGGPELRLIVPRSWAKQAPAPEAQGVHVPS